MIPDGPDTPTIQSATINDATWGPLYQPRYTESFPGKD